MAALQPIKSSKGLHRVRFDETVVHTSIDTLRKRLLLPERLFSLAQLDCLYEEDSATLWTFMRPRGRPSFNQAMLADFCSWQEDIAATFGPSSVPLNFVVLGSRVPNVFCYGGDLDLFCSLIRASDREGLIRYGRTCVEILHRNMACLGLPVVTIGLVQGAALGGGWEALMSFNVVIAERGSTFSFPEVTFNLFPGMGAHAILSRRLGSSLASRMILSGKAYSVEYLYDLGLVHHIAEPGEGITAVRDFIHRSRRHHAGHVGSYRAMHKASPIALDELVAIVTEWADTALKLSDRDLKLMDKIVAHQNYTQKQHTKASVSAESGTLATKG